MDSDLEFTYFEIQFRGDPVADLRDCNFLFFFFLGGGGGFEIRERRKP